MTSRALYDGVLIELHKENAPNILLEDFNYFANKAINQYINKRYNIYDVNQQTTDDLRVLKATAVLTPHKVTDTYDGLSLANMATYYVDLPTDYLHLLNCICIYNVKKTYKCYNAGDTWRAAATRLTADAYSQVLDNFWTKPSYKRPYYYIHNINTSETIPTNPVDNINTWLKVGTDRSEFIDYSDPNVITKYNGKTFKFIDSTTTVEGAYLYHDLDDKESDYILDVNDEGDSTYIDPELNTIYQTVVGELYEAKKYSKQEGGQSVEYYKWELKSSQDRSGNPIINTSDKNMFSSIDIYGTKTSNIERASQVRYGNASKVRLEIRYGTDNSVFTLD